AVRRRDAGGEPAQLGASQALLLPLHARRVGRARRLPRPGPGAVRLVLRPDADPLLLPDRRLGPGTRPNQSHDQARHLHPGGLAAHARRGHRHRRARLAAGRRAHHLRALRAARAAAEQRLAGVDLPVLRRRLPRQDAGLPAARLDARRLPRDADRGADGLLGRALQGRRLRLSGDRAAALPPGRRALPDADAADRARLDPLRLRTGLQPDRRSPDRRVLLGGPARLHHARHLLPELPGGAGRAEDGPQMGGLAFRAPVLASLFLVVALATLAIPGSSNFVGEFLILLGVFKAKLAIAIIAFSGVVLASVYALRLFIRAMHNRVGPASDSREIGFLDGAVLAPLIAVIVFLALYPQFALHRSERSVKAAVQAAYSESGNGLSMFAHLPGAVGASEAGTGEVGVIK